MGPGQGASSAVVGLLAVAGLLSHCAEPTAPHIAAFDASWSKGDSCHTDCFGGRYCLNGLVLEMKSEALPCNSGKSCTTTVVHTCALGCNPYPPAKYPGDPALFCGEYPKLPGDPCTNDGQCQPSSAPSAGLPSAATMSCDTTYNACISPSQPALADFRGSCGLPADLFADSAWSARFGIASVETCSAKVCLIAFRLPYPNVASDQGCLTQSCTKTCDTSWDCPPTARCAYVPSLAIAGKKGDTGSGEKVCVPAEGQTSVAASYAPQACY